MRDLGTSRICRLFELTPTQGYTYSAALGYLSAVCRADPVVGTSWSVTQEVHQLAPFDPASGVGEVIASLGRGPVPDVVGFSVSFWNRRPSLECARVIKQNWPDVKVVIGGSDVSFQGDVLLVKDSPLDFIVNGEAESTMPELLHAIEHDRPWDEVHGISYRAHGEVQTTPRRALIADLDSIASPFLTGVVGPKPLSEATLLVYESNRGCPYSCAYCFWGGATRTAIRCFSLERIERELDFIVSHCRPHMVFFLADANFGILERDLDLARLMVKACERYNKTITFNTNWTKKPREATLEAARILYSAGLLGGVTVSVQSFDRSVMRKAKRTNIRPPAYRDLLARLRSFNIATYTDLIWGLPGQTYETLLEDIDTCLDAGGCPVAYPLLLLPNTEFFSPEMRETYAMETELIPSDLTTPALTGEMVVAHSTLDKENWKRGMRLIMGMNLFWKCLFRATITYVVQVANLKYSHILDLLTEEMYRENLGDPVIGALLEDFERTIAGFQPPRSQRALSMVGESGLPEQAHFQALLKRFVHGDPGERALGHLVLVLQSLAPEVELAEVMEIDRVARLTIRSSLREVEPCVVELSSEVEAVLVDASVLPGVEGIGEGRRLLRSGDVSERFRFPAYALAIWHGGEIPLRDAELVIEPAEVL